MSVELYQKCEFCGGIGLDPDFADYSGGAIPSKPRCPSCRGEKFVSVGLTTGQVEIYARYAEKFRAVLRLCLEPLPGGGYGAWRAPGPGVKTVHIGDFGNRMEAVSALKAEAKALCLGGEAEAWDREEREVEDLKAEVGRLRKKLVDLTRAIVGPAMIGRPLDPPGILGDGDGDAS